MSISIIRTFVSMRELLASLEDIARRVEKLERRYGRAASVIEVLVDDIDRLGKDTNEMRAAPVPSKRRIGFKV